MTNNAYKREQAYKHNMRRAETAAYWEDKVRFPPEPKPRGLRSARELRMLLIVGGLLSTDIGQL
jgi:hypothetical protein